MNIYAIEHHMKPSALTGYVVIASHSTKILPIATGND